MLDKLKKLIRNEFKKANIKAFSFFLLFSVIIWLLVQFSKHYTEVIAIPLTFINAPKDKIVDKTEDKLDLRVNESGFQLAWHKLSSPEVEVDLNKLPLTDGYFAYNLEENRKDLKNQLPIDINKVDFLRKEIRVPFHQKAIKRVPVLSAIKTQFAPGYSSENGVRLSPDSVRISGPKEMLDTINQLQTKLLKKKNIKTDQKDSVAIAKPPYPQLSLYRNNVEYALEVAKFTEKSVSIPITVINTPKDKKISLFPSEITATFKVSLERYNQIQSLDFRVICDYEETKNNSKYLIPKLAKKPKDIKNISLSPRKILYVIKK